MAVTRRTIWMNDEDWTALTQRATTVNVSVSAYIRALMEGVAVGPNRVLIDVTDADEPVIVPKGAGVVSTIVGRGSGGSGRNPYTEFHPAPKRGKAK